MANEKFNQVKSCGVTFTKLVDLPCPHFGTYLTLYNAYKRGTLPFEGSFADQPAQIIDVYTLLDQLYHEAEVKAREDAKRKQNRVK